MSLNNLLLVNEEIQIDKIIKILNKLCSGKYQYKIKQAASTNSLYIKIYKEEDQVVFRISDHHGKNESLPSFPVKKHTQVSTLERFVKNRISKLEERIAERKLDNLFDF